jgi:serine/threonine-protein kinase
LPSFRLSELTRGQMLDRYELIYAVAQGGMATVWLARLKGKHGFEKQVALKTILPSFAEDARFRRMLLDEARIASRIEHVNVAQTLDLGEHDGHLYLVMEWVEGDSLSKLSRAVERAGSTLPLPILLRVVVEACAGLHAAHELCDDQGERLGVVHRDVSPQNILVSVKGQTKLIDFGIAKAQAAPSEETRAGILKGKLYYMPPEQALRRPVDRRADVWAIGAVLYRLLSGRTPYESASPVTSLKLLTTRSSPPPLPASIDRELSALVLRALSPEPAERPSTALELQAALEQLAPALGGLATSQELASFVTTHLGQPLQERRDKISNALRASDEAPTSLRAFSSKAALASSARSEADTTPDRLVPLVAVDAEAFSPSVSSSALTLQMGSRPPASARSSKWPLIGAGLALVLLGAWGFLGRAEPPVAPAHRAPPPPSPTILAAPTQALAEPSPPVVTPAALPAEPASEAHELPAPVLPSALPLSVPSPARASSKAPLKRTAKLASNQPVAKASSPKHKVIDDGF